jgi:hypothetical protein
MGPPPPALNARLVEDGSADAGTLADRERGEPRREDPDLTTSLIFSCCGAASASRLQHGRFRKSLSPTVANALVPLG